MLLLKRGGLEPKRINESLDEVFSRRKTHELPDKVNTPPANWKLVFDKMAKECNANIDIEKAFIVLKDFIESLRDE